MKAAKVAHLTSVHSPFDVRIFHKECKSLARHGYEVVLIAPHHADEIADGVKVKALKKCQGRLSRMTLGAWRMFWEALKQHADIYHIHDPELIPVALLLRMRGKQAIYDIHEDLPRTIPYKHYLPRWSRWPLMWIVERLENAACPYFTALITATSAIAERFRGKNSRITVVHNFPILDPHSPEPQFPWGQREMAVVYIGSITRNRGIVELMEAMSMLPNNVPLRLKLAGTFSPDEFQDEVHALPGWERVDYLGFLGRGQVADLLGRVRGGLLVLHPEENYLRSMPIKLFEYMAAEIPVIASDFPLWRQIIEEAGCGLLVDPLNPAAIAAAIERLHNHTAEAEKMGKRGRAALVLRYTWASEEQRLEQLYESLVGDPAAANSVLAMTIPPHLSTRETN